MPYIKLESAVILAAGNGSRLQPVTNFIPKTMVLYKDKPILYHHIKNLIDNGIKDIIIISRKDEDNNYCFKVQNDYVKGLEKELKQYDKNISIKLVYQNVDSSINKPRGPADALAAAKDKLIGKKYLVINGDNIIIEKNTDRNFLSYFIEKFNGEVMFSTTKVDKDEALKCGVFKHRKLDDMLEISELKEKPSSDDLEKYFGKHEKYAVTYGGLYALNEKSMDYIIKSPAGANNEKHIVDAINLQIKEEKRNAYGLDIDKNKYETLDFGNIENWLKANLTKENRDKFMTAIKSYPPELLEVIYPKISKYLEKNL